MRSSKLRTTLVGMLLAAAASLITAGLGAASEQPARLRANTPDLSAIHDANSASFNKNCLKCHADVMKRRTLDRKIKNAHAAMLPFAPGYKKEATNEVCISCHSKVDVVQHSAAQIRRNVSASMCAACHGRSGQSSKKFYAN